MNTPLNDLIELHELAQRHENENCVISLHSKIAGGAAAPRMPAVTTKPIKSMSILNESVHTVDSKMRRL